MATNNSWNNKILNSFAGITLNSNTQTTAISSDGFASTLWLGTGAAAKTVVLGSTTSSSSTTIQSGSGALNITSTNGALTIDSGTGALGISTDASATTLSIGTGGAVKGITLGSTNSTSSTTVQSGSGALNVTATGGALTINSGTGALSISNDASATTVAIATGGAVKGVTLGSTNSTSATTVQSGSGALNVTATNGALTINSGTGTLSISSDASAATVNIATGGAAKVVTLGSTNGASSLALKTGTADFSLASATGTLISALDTGEITTPLQPAFCAALSASQNNVTGTAAAWININANTEIYDVNSDYDNGTFTFTAPVTGKYYLLISSVIIGCTIATQIGWRIVTSNRTYENQLFRAASSQNLGIVVGLIADMDAADTAQFFTLSGGEGGVTDDIYGDGTVGGTFCQGYLLG